MASDLNAGRDEELDRFGQVPGVGTLLRTLADLPDGEFVARAVRHEILHEWHPAFVAVRSHEPIEDCLRLVAHSGLPREFVHDSTTLPVEAATPDGDCFRSGEPINLTMREVATRYPLLERWISPDSEATEGEITAMPVRAGGRRIGVITVALGMRPPDAVAVHLTLEMTASAIALWLMAAGHLETGNGGRRSSARIRLTDRQKKILALVEDGWTNLAIANELNFSVATVKSDLAGLMRRLGAADRYDLVERVRRSHL